MLVSCGQPHDILPPRHSAGKTGEQMAAASQKRLAEAYTLRTHKHWVGALYLGGYAIEMMLKWALNDAVGEVKIPRRYTTAQWHNLNWMMAHSPFLHVLQREPQAYTWWSTISEWDSNWRYESKLPSRFSSRPEKEVPEWLNCVKYLTVWLTAR